MVRSIVRGCACLLLCAWSVATHASLSVNPSPSQGSHTVSWTYGAPPAGGYFQLMEGFNGGAAAAIWTGTAASHAVTGRAAGTYVYTLNVCQVYPYVGLLCIPWFDQSGVPHQATVQVSNAPPVPGPIQGPDTSSSGGYTLTWGASAGATSYELQQQVNGGSFATVQNTSATTRMFSGQSDGTYGYRVRACLQSACSAWTATKTVQVQNPPGVPGPISGPSTSSSGTYGITWTASSGTVTSYRLEERVSGGAFAQIQNSTALSKSFVGKINNTYEYRVRACNAYGCSAYTGIKSVQVTGNPGSPDLPATPPAAEVPTAPPASAQSDAVGVVAGTFRVDESGAATYSIPIPTLPGSGGVAPVVSLDYSSQAGNGIAGVGWRLSGPSAITRCRQTRETDNAVNRGINFDANDRFCLDGQRLMQTSAGSYGGNGVEYRTEIDQVAKIVSYGSQGSGPQYFRVWRKDGSVSDYGTTADSRIEAFGANSSVYVWAQSRFADTADNYFTFHYTEDTASGLEYVLDRIAYTGNGTGIAPNAELRFVYDTVRPDRTRGFFAGVALKQTRRLTAIGSFLGSTEIERHELTYEAAPVSNVSRLTAVTRCSAGVCLQPTTFDWQNAGGGFASTVTENYYTRYFRGAKPADVDGDGDADMVWLRLNNNGEPKIEIMRSQNGQLVPQGQVLGANSSEAASWQILDYNNDGRHDLLLAEGNYWQVRLGTVDGSGNPTFGSPINTLIPPDGFNRAAVADFDGNGLADFLYTQAGSLRLRPLLKSGSTYAFGPVQSFTLGCAPFECDGYFPPTVMANDIRPVVADFNGDGVADLLLRVSVTSWCEPEFGGCPPPVTQWRIYVGNPGTTSFDYFDSVAIDTVTNEPRYVLGDLNGDGLTDIAYAEGTGNVWKYRLSTGVALGAATTIVTLASTTERTAIVDVNGDGRQDFLYTSGGTWFARYATETGLSGTATNTGLPSKVGSHAQSGWVGYFQDLNGDGRADYVRYFLGDNTSLTYTYVRLGKDPFVAANVVSAITSGYGARTEIEYQAFTDPARASNYYTKSTDGRLATWGKGTPVIDLHAPIYAVKRVQSSAPAAGGYPGQVDTQAMSAIGYRYGGAKLQGGGRGFLGFASLTTVDEQTGIQTTTTYRQDFPYVGSPASTTVRTAGGQVLSSAQNTWADRTSGNGPFRQPYLAQSVEHSCDLATAGATCTAANALTSVTTTTTVDTYLNALTVNVSTSGGGLTASKNTTNTYTDDVANWKLGRLTATTVEHTRTGQPSVTRTAHFRYAETTGLLDREITEPNGPAAERLTTTYALDGFGNRRMATVNGWDGTGTVNRTTTLTFDARGRYVLERHNAFNQLAEVASNHNARGQPLQVTDIASKSTYFSYGAFGQEYFRYDPTGAWVETRQALCSQVGGCPPGAHYRSRTTVAGGGQSDVYFDVLGREVRTATIGFDGREIYVDTEYDPSGRVARKSEPYFANEASYWTEFAYDVLGRVISVRHPDYPATGNETTSSYAGLVTTLINGKLQQKVETRNALGELVQVTDALGNGVTYTYDATGNLKTSLQTASDTATTALTTLTHDRLGRKTAMTDANMGTWGYVYNAFGELIQQNTGISGKYTTVAYDLLGRMTTRIDWTGGGAGYTGGTQEANAGWIYDACPNGLGQLCQEDTIPGGPPNPASLVRVYGYGPYGRPTSVTTTIAGSVYTAATTYDQHGRVFQAFDGAETHSGLQYQYGPYGHREAAIESRGSASVTVERYRITGLDARGQVTGMLKGGIEVNRAYAADTGRLDTLYARNAGYVTLQDFAFTFDVLGNLTEKNDLRRSLGESYSYDALNRLTAVGGSASLTVTYNGLGNITSKSNVGSYGYQTGGTRPHAVTSAGGVNYTYDANGNQVSGTNGRSVSYAVHNKPVSMSRSGATVTVDYGPNRERFRRIDVQGGSTTTTHYVGSIEKVWRPGGVIQVKRYLDGELIETIEGSTRTVEYLLTDHLGSVDVVVNAAGSIVQSMAFDPFGRRRSPTNYAALADSTIWSFDTTRTTRGYTGHEQLDPVGLVHMNGRVYDPTLGRFLSPDPFVQDPSNTQSLNRYTYVFNNPLSYTDPSGYFSLKEAFGIAVGIAATWWTGGLAAGWGWGFVASGAFGGASGAFASTVAMGGSIKAAFTSAGYGAISGAMFGALGGKFGGVIDFKSVVSYGIAGGMSSIIQGGSFGPGFVTAGLSAPLSAVLTGMLDGWFADPEVFASVIAAGTLSEATGGNFVNGAYTVALSGLFARYQGFVEPSDRENLQVAGCAYSDASSCGALKRVAFGTSESGIKWSAYQADGGGVVRVGFAGTNGLSDLDDNVRNAAGLRSTQYREARQIAQALAAERGGNIVFVGHSLGGGLAAAASAATGLPAVTFQAASTSSAAFTGGDPGLIRAYYTRSDILSIGQDVIPGIGSARGQRVMLGPHGWHGIKAICSAMRPQC
ncbi:MAG: VCBS repeat-containing protein [Pseudomonadales bacterium]|nr:VCBS repeat-containing protein [Pseudomonadales bacterium]